MARGHWRHGHGAWLGVWGGRRVTLLAHVRGVTPNPVPFWPVYYAASTHDTDFGDRLRLRVGPLILHPCMAACAAPQSPALARLEIERAVTGRAARVPIEPSVVPGCARACAACVVCVCSACPKAPKVVDGAVMALIAQEGAQSDVCQPGAQSSQPAGLSLSAARSAYPPPWLSVGAGWAAAGSPCARGAAPARGYGWG